CEGGDSTWEIPADPLFCELAPVPCGEGNIRTIHGKCDYIRDPTSSQPLSKEKTIQVIYYFDSGCNPTAHGSLPLPSPGYIPCDMTCPAGSYLDGDKCRKCKPGTYSMGGGIRFDAFYELDDRWYAAGGQLKAGPYSNPVLEAPIRQQSSHMAIIHQTPFPWCVSPPPQPNRWYAAGGQLKAGPYDPPNEWYPPGDSTTCFLETHDCLPQHHNLPLQPATATCLCNLPLQPATATCHCNLPLQPATATCHCNLPLQPATATCHCNLPLQPATATCHCNLPLQLATATCLCNLPLQPASATCHCNLPLQPATATCHCNLPLQPATATCLCNLPLQPATATCHCNLPLQLATATCLCNLPLQPASATCHCNLPLQLATATCLCNLPLQPASATCHCNLPLQLATATCLCNLPLQPASATCHCNLPLQPATATCHCNLPLQLATATCLCNLPLQPATATCHCNLPLQPASATCHCNLPLQPATATCHCNLPLQPASATCLCNLPLQPATATCHCNLPLQPASATCHCNLPLQLATATCLCNLPLQPATATCHCNLPLQLATATCHCNLSYTPLALPSDDCSLGSYNCHNNLRASLRMQVELITSGLTLHLTSPVCAPILTNRAMSVRYRFTVSAEHKFDGLPSPPLSSDVPLPPALSSLSHPPNPIPTHSYIRYRFTVSAEHKFDGLLFFLDSSLIFGSPLPHLPYTNPPRSSTCSYIRYKFTVSAEHKFDGLLFFLDSSPEPLMGLESNQFEPIEVQIMLEPGIHTLEWFDPMEVQIMLEPGIHTLEWVYYKDSKFTKGRDSAALHLVEVGGIDYTDRQCFPCQAGFYSEEGSTECAPCPVDHYSREGWPECKPCSAEEYAQSPPRANCTARPPCNVTTHAAPTYGNCSSVDNQRIKTWAWLTPHICAPHSEDEDLPADTHEPCPPCPSGQYAVEDSTTRTRLCHFCPPGLARNASSSSPNKPCRKCPPGEVAVKALTMDHFELHRGKLPDGFVTGCSGDCGSLGWRVVNGKLDFGSNHGKSASVRFPPSSPGVAIYDVSMAVDRQARHIPLGRGNTTARAYLQRQLLSTLSLPSITVSPSSLISSPPGVALVWLSYDVSMAVDGYITFAYDVDIPRGDLQRGLFFYVNDQLVLNIEVRGGEVDCYPVDSNRMQSG
ncbi:unnamed protein product, partial [Closterium sp. Naga37s-1]